MRYRFACIEINIDMSTTILVIFIRHVCSSWFQHRSLRVHIRLRPLPLHSLLPNDPGIKELGRCQRRKVRHRTLLHDANAILDKTVHPLKKAHGKGNGFWLLRYVLLHAMRNLPGSKRTQKRLRCSTNNRVLLGCWPITTHRWQINPIFWIKWTN